MRKEQTKSNKVFWQEFLAVGRKRRTEAEWTRAYYLAISWDTCACSSINDGLPRRGANMPIDSVLQNLGIEFEGDVLEKNTRMVRTRFNQIQKRARVVLNGL